MRRLGSVDVVYVSVREGSVVSTPYYKAEGVFSIIKQDARKLREARIKAALVLAETQCRAWRALDRVSEGSLYYHDMTAHLALRLCQGPRQRLSAYEWASRWESVVRRCRDMLGEAR